MTKQHYDDELRTKLTRSLSRIYRAALTGEEAVERRYALKPPYPWSDMGRHMSEFREWTRFWRQPVPYWTVELTTHRPKNLGEQTDCPAAVVFHSAQSMLDYLGLSPDYEKLRHDYEQLVAGHEELGAVVLRHRKAFLADRSLAASVLHVADYFAAHGQAAARPRYLRELDIPHVHTKWIEDHKELATAVYGALYPASGVRTFTDFCDHLDLLVQAPTANIYLRSLDPELTFGGAQTVMLTGAELLRIRLPFRYVFVAENKLNGYTFPAVPAGAVIFGAGNAASGLLAATADQSGNWLSQCQNLYYWGDMDRDGFRILSRFRRQFPQVKSLLMDRDTFAAYDEFAVPDDGSEVDMPELLTAEEQRGWQYMTEQPSGAQRLEQERIPLAAVRAALAGIVPGILY